MSIIFGTAKRNAAHANPNITMSNNIIIAPEVQS